jgi:UTP--glucose-1-phosphate uridylyltransferase
MTDQKVRKAVIAAAGFGTRFLPQTKAMPKEMLPLVDKPIIQYIVEELVAAGIEDIVIVTGFHKRSIEDHFDHTSTDLNNSLTNSGKDELLEQVKKISGLANFAYIRQKGPYGTGTPLLNAADWIGDQPFIYTYADDFVDSDPPRFKQLIDLRATHGGSVLTCVKRGDDADFTRYGYVGGDEISKGVVEINKIIEKPGLRENSPSDLASVSGYLLEPVIFEYLAKLMENYDESHEFQMQSALQQMMDDGLKVYGCEIQNGNYYDTGNPLEYLKTVFDFALKREDIGPDLKAYLRNKLK